MMAYTLTRDPNLLNLLSPTFGGTATLQSKEGENVLVPLSALLGASTLVSGIVANSHLHPAVHGPLILSCALSTDVLVSVGDILGRGEAFVIDNDNGEIKNAMDMFRGRYSSTCADKYRGNQ